MKSWLQNWKDEILLMTTCGRQCYIISRLNFPQFLNNIYDKNIIYAFPNKDKETILDTHVHLSGL